MGARREGLGRVCEKEEGIKRYKLVFTKQSWDVTYSINNIVNNVIIMCDVRWVLDLLR